LRLIFGSYPDHYDTFAPHMDGEFVPAIRNADGVMVANEKYKNEPGAELRVGNLPNKGPGAANSGVHTGDDVVLTAMGPGADKVHGLMENTDLFRVMAEALALSPQEKSAPTKAKKK
jgi:alkaline phosphatase